MNTTIKSAIVAALFVLSTNVIAVDNKAEKIRPNIIGKTYVFDYGDFAYDVTISSDKSLHWKLVKGSFEGSPDNGDNPYLLSKIADGIIFLSWKEESGMQYYNVINFKTGKLTTHGNDASYVNTGTVSSKK
ncbi:MAG: hypothetical protein K8H84_14305 [Sulfuricella denitrificans]|nr:hypothetical protein [Sulfuricella denitrificans]